MRYPFVTLFAAALAVFGPAAAAPPAPPRTLEVINRDTSLIAAWVTRINQAVEPANAAIVTAQSKMQAILATVHDRDSARAAATQLRAVLQTQRSAIALAQANLAAIPASPPGGARIPEFDVTKALSDGRALVAQLLEYTDSLIGFMNAAEKGDVETVRAAMPMIARGGLLIVDGQVAVYRNRQALLQSDEPTYQAAGVTVALYTALGIAERASMRAAFDHQPEQAAAEERASLRGLADQIAALTRTGRRNLSHMLAQIPDFGARSRGEEAQLVAKVRVFADAEEAFFVVGDQLESWARVEGQENEAVRAKFGQSATVRKLFEMELRLASIQRSAAAAVAGGQQP